MPIRFDTEEEYERIRNFFLALAPMEAWCNTDLMSHGIDYFCPVCSRFIQGKEYESIDEFHFNFKCRYCGLSLYNIIENKHDIDCPYRGRGI